MACDRRPAAALVLLLTLAACGGGGGDQPTTGGSEPSLTAEIVQLRSDEPLEQIEVSLANTGAEKVVVERLQVRMRGFDSGRPVPKDSPIAPGQVANLPWPYGAVRCGPDGEPSIGRAVVRLRIHTDSAPAAREMRLMARDPKGVLERIAKRACTVSRIAREVTLGFGSRWRPEQTREGVVLHGTLEARLLADQPRTLTEVAGAIMYGLRPDVSAGPVGAPLAALTPSHPEASIPVEFFASRCDGHVKGEIKKPYEFLVWVAEPGIEPIAVTPAIDQGTKDALQQVCSF